MRACVLACGAATVSPLLSLCCCLFAVVAGLAANPQQQQVKITEKTIQSIFFFFFFFFFSLTHFFFSLVKFHVRHFAKQSGDRPEYRDSSSSEADSDRVHEGRWARPHQGIESSPTDSSSSSSETETERGDDGQVKVPQGGRHPRVFRAVQPALGEAVGKHRKQSGDRLNYGKVLHELHNQRGEQPKLKPTAAPVLPPVCAAVTCLTLEEVAKACTDGKVVQGVCCPECRL